MENKSLLPIIASIVAVVVLIAAAVFVLNNGNDDNKEYDYSVYAEVIGADGTVSSTMTVEFKTTAQTNAAYIEAANKAFKDAGLDVTFTEDDGSIFVKYGTSTNNACYYYSDSKWVAISDTATQYSHNSHVALMLGHGYISADVYNALSADDQAGYKETGWGEDYAYIKLPDQLTYAYYVEIIGNDGVVTDQKWFEFTCVDSLLANYVAAANEAFKTNGIDASFTIGDYVILTYAGSSYNATYYYTGSEWKAVADTSTDYVNSGYVALMLGNGYISADVYNALSADEQAGYKETGWGGAYAYQKLPDPYTYTVQYQVIASDGTDSGAPSTFRFTCDLVDMDCYVAAANKAAEDLELPLVFSISTYGISVKYDGSGINACYYYDSVAKKYTEISETATQYIGNELVYLMLGHGYISADVYNALSVDDKASYRETGWGGAYAYIRLAEMTDYEIYYQIIGDNGKTTSRDCIKFESPSCDNYYYLDAVNEAFAEKEVPVVFSESTWGISVKYDGSGINACYYYNYDTEKYTLIQSTGTQYSGSTLVALMLGHGYISAEIYNALTDDEKAGYEATTMSGDYAYVKIPDLYDYTIKYEVINDDGTTSTTTGSVNFSIPFCGVEYFVSEANEAFKAVSVDAELTISDTYITVSYGESTNSATYYYDGSKWVAVQDTMKEYLNNGVLAFMLGNGYISADKYNALSSDVQALYTYTGWGGAWDYQRMPSPGL